MWGMLRRKRSLLAPPPLRHAARWLLARCQDSPHYRRIQFVFALADVSAVVLYAQHENRQSPFFIEILSRHCDREHSVELVLAVRGLVAVLFKVPGKDSHLIEVIGQPVMRFGEHGEILRNF